MNIALYYVLFIHYFISDQTRLSVWVADGDPSHANLLKFALNEEQFPHTLVILVASMTTPWAILDQLQSWMNFLNDHIDNLIKKNEAFKDVLKHCQELSKYIFYSLIA